MKQNDFDLYFMDIAHVVKKKSVCLGRQVGALIVKEQNIIATGYNGTPSGTPNCDIGGCYRCKTIYIDKVTSNLDRGFGYDVCCCCHAEENCLIRSAKFGISVDGGTLYTTLSPCFLCTRMALQAGIKRVVYDNIWIHPNEGVQNQLQELQRHFESFEKIF